MEHLLEKSGSVSCERILANSTLLWAVLLPPLPPHQCHYHTPTFPSSNTTPTCGDTMYQLNWRGEGEGKLKCSLPGVLLHRIYYYKLLFYYNFWTSKRTSLQRTTAEFILSLMCPFFRRFYLPRYQWKCNKSLPHYDHLLLCTFLGLFSCRMHNGTQVSSLRKWIVALMCALLITLQNCDAMDFWLVLNQFYSNHLHFFSHIPRPQACTWGKHGL